MKKKVVILVLAAMLVLGCAMGATLAWLTSSATVTNTFTPSDINITLTETKPAVDKDGNHIAKMVPGSTIEKNPSVTVEQGSEKCFLFVQIQFDNMGYVGAQLDPYISFDIADGWTQLTKDSQNKLLPAGIYYRIVDTDEQDTAFDILKDNQVTVNANLGKSEMKALKDAGKNVDMTFTAYAVQYENIAVAGNTDAQNAALAWANRVQ